MVINFSLLILGSEEVQKQVLEDIKDLVKTCYYENLIPLFLVVGPLFINISCAQKIKENLDIEDWYKESKVDYDKLSKLLRKLKIKTLKRCENEDGILTESGDLLTYYKPDEKYISIYAVDPSRMAIKGEEKVKSGQPLQIISYSDDDILVEFNPDYIIQ